MHFIIVIVSILYGYNVIVRGRWSAYYPRTTLLLLHSIIAYPGYSVDHNFYLSIRRLILSTVMEKREWSKVTTVRIK